MWIKKAILIFFIFITTLHSNQRDKVTLQLDWLHQFQFAGYYVAKENNYYKHNNLDVEIKEYDYSTNLIDDVLQNQNHYSVGKSSLIIDKMNGKDIVLLAAIFQNSPMVLISLDKSNITKIQDLENRNVMLTPDARSAANITSMIKSTNTKLENINFIRHSFKLKDLVNGNTDAMGCFLSNEPFSLIKQNIKFNIFNPKDYGFDFYGGLLFTSEEELNNNPQRVKSFYDATIKGWAYAFENIEETAQLIFDKYNTQNKTLEALIYEGKILKKLSSYEKGYLGNLDSKKIDEIKRLYSLLGFSSKQNFKSDKLIFNKNKYLFNNQEKEFLKNTPISLISTINKIPFSFKKDLKIEGIEADLWHLINKKLNKNYPIIDKIDTNNKLKTKVYLEFNYSINIENKKNPLLTKPLNKVSMAIATKNNKNFILDLSVLKDKKIAILENSLFYLNIKASYPNLEFIEVKNIKESFHLLKEDKVFGVIDNILSLSYEIIKNDYNNIKVTNTLPYDLEIRLKSKKEDYILIDILNKIIEQIPQKEKDMISQKYQLLLYKHTNDYSWIYKYLLPLIILLLIIMFTNAKMRHEIKKRKIAERALKEYANKDSLTKVFNRRKIEILLSRQIKLSKKNEGTFSIIFFDIDNFKSINDEFGHERGDKVLITISDLVSKNIREFDYIGRWGGEEFIVILPNTKDTQAFDIAKKLKELILNTDFKIQRQLTSSFGITQYKIDDKKIELVKRADEAMYFVKNNGKNAVKIN